MSDFFFHPQVVHIPIALAVLVPVVAGGLLVAIWLRWLPARAWLVAVGLQLALLTGGVLALESGEREEDRVEQIVPEAALEGHEEAAGAFMVVNAAVLLVLLVGGMPLPGRWRTGAMGLGTATTLLALGFGIRTGQSGGELVYRHGAARAHVSVSAATTMREAKARDHHDDDDDDCDDEHDHD